VPRESRPRASGDERRPVERQHRQHKHVEDQPEDPVCRHVTESAAAILMAAPDYLRNSHVLGLPSTCPFIAASIENGWLPRRDRASRPAHTAGRSSDGLLRQRARPVVAVLWKPLRPVRAVVQLLALGHAFRNDCAFAGKFHSTQCTQVPAGASGSSMISAKLSTFAGAPLHCNPGNYRRPCRCMARVSPLRSKGRVVM